MAEVSKQIEPTKNPRLTWEGCSVLLDVNDGDRLVFARLTSSATLKIGNKKCSLSPLIGCPFGSLFQVESGPKGSYLSPVLATLADSHMQEQNESQLKDEGKDNRALVDNNTAQSLSCEDIDAMRRVGATGEQIVEALISSSSTFQNKTSFSQEKYRIRKQKKYAPRVLLRRPFARSVCEAYFRKYPARIGFLRVDALSLLLSMANVSAYSDVIVVDMVGGILTGAVAERLGGTGYVCNTYFGCKQYPMDIVGIFNFNSEICNRIVRSPFSDFCLSQNGNVTTSNGSISISEEHVIGEGTSPNSKSEHGVTDMSPCSSRVSDDISESNDSTVLKSSKSVKLGRQAMAEDIKLWKEKGFTSMIVAAPELDTWSIVKDLFPLLSFSAPFAIYHQYLQPLATCMHNLHAEKMAIGLQISEPWLREYQVLPSRTHPFMQMCAFGGYILSGIRICNSAAGQENK